MRFNVKQSDRSSSEFVCGIRIVSLNIIKLMVL
jgi:hypothetical protein